jgi:tricorn protease-like protein
MAFNNTSPLSYAFGAIVKYIDAARGVSEDIGGPKLEVVGVYDKKTGDIAEFNQTSNTANVYSVAVTANSSLLIAANTSTRGATMVNESANTLFIAYAANANSSVYTYAIPSQATWEMPNRVWTGPISGFLGGGTGAARITVLF